MTEQTLRIWQLDAKNEFDRLGRPRDFTVSATPGAGKTTFSLSHALDLMKVGEITRLVVVVPTDSLRTQWCGAANQMGLDLRPVNDPTDWTRGDYHGVVVTYAQIKASSSHTLLARRAVASAPTMVVLDEIHHAGESKSWGDGLVEAFEGAAFRLMLTGTPWRRSKQERIPFVTYDDDKVHVDHAYEYGEAVRDEVCRRVVFEAYDCETVRWVDCGTIVEAQLDDGLLEVNVPAVLETVYMPGSDWITTLLRRADAALTRVRREDAPDAGALVVCKSQYHAREYAETLKSITGESATLVVSDDGPQAKVALDAFRSSTARWLVAVDMVSEGVDIPRLAVGVYASSKQTPLFFRQVVGRFVRTRTREEMNAILFIPAVPSFKRLATEIEEELRHQLDLEIDAQEKRDLAAERSQREFAFREPLSATDAMLGSTIVAGEALSQADLDAGIAACQENGIPATYAPNMARLLKVRLGNEVRVTITHKAPDLPKHKVEKMLRAEVKALVGKVEYREGRQHGTLNGDLLREGYRPRAQMTIDELQTLRADLASRLGNG